MFARYMISAAIVLAGCDFDSGPPSEVLGGALAVEGDVVDFQTGAAITAPASITTTGVTPAPRVTVQGAAFTIDDIPENSVFQIRASAPPTYHLTVSQTIVTSADLSDVKAPAVSEAFLASLTTAFKITPSADKGIALVRLVDAAGKPRAGVAAANLSIAGASAPRFLDANLMPAAAAVTSSASGWVVFFDVPAGVVSMTQAAGATVTVDMAAAALEAGGVTIATATVTDGAPALPTNVKFATQIVPIFQTRGCQACHSGGGIGKDLGGLTLDGGTNLIYKELVEERPGIRVSVAAPDKSLVLTMPSAETPPDRHPNVTFTGPRDPDYVKLLVWIREGALNN